MVSSFPRSISRLTAMPHASLGATSSVLLSFYLCAVILVSFVGLSDAFLHWFIVPILACGVLIGIDAVDWCRKRLDTFDPIGLLGLYGLYFFFLAPLLHVLWDQWTLFKVTPPADWREWLGAMAFLNMLGLLLYRATRWLVVTLDRERPMRVRWQLHRPRFYVIVSGALVLAGVLELLVFTNFGGLAGYIAAAKNSAKWEGLGYTLAIAESFPVLAFMAVTVFASQKVRFRGWPSIILMLLVFATITFFFRGLRGNRSDMIWPLFWMIGIVHFQMRPLPRKLLYIGLPLFILFMYVYQFYDFYGLNRLSQISSPAAHTALAKRTGYSFRAVLLGDLARSDVQAFLLHRLAKTDRNYQYAWGRTYISGVRRLIPQTILDRPANKAMEGTEAQYGWGAYTPGVLQSSKVYGLAGEAMLNFGPLAVPFIFIVLGGVVGAVRQLILALQSGDSRKLLAPFLINLCIVVLIGDLDNMVWFLVKDGGLPTLVLLTSSSLSVVGAIPVLEKSL